MLVLAAGMKQILRFRQYCHWLCFIVFSSNSLVGMERRTVIIDGLPLTDVLSANICTVAVAESWGLLGLGTHRVTNSADPPLFLHCGHPRGTTL